MQTALRLKVSGLTQQRVAGKLLLVACLFLAALGIRLYHINEPPLSFHATRQYRSMLIARGYFYEMVPELPEWKRNIAHVSHERQGVLEPPVMEMLVAVGYRLVGSEQYWLPRLLASLFWLLGGGFLYALARRIAGTDAALVSTGVYLFLPFGVVASRSFQPDPLMVMLLLASLYTQHRYFERPSMARLIPTTSVSGLAILVKPISLFVIFAVFISLALGRYGFRQAIANPRLLLFSLTSLVPVFTFYVYGIFVAGFLREQARSSFLPQLVLQPFFWKSWLSNIGLVSGYALFIIALLGGMMFATGPGRALIRGMWLGYALFCVTFAYHIATHDYYHLQLVPIIALSMAPIVVLVARHWQAIPGWRYRQVALWTIGLLVLIVSIATTQPRLIGSGYASQVRIAEEIGAHVGHSANTVYLDADYGLALEYHGELSGLPWPLVSDLEWERLAGIPVLSADERFNAWFAKASPDFFIVNDRHDFERQPDLQDFLRQRFAVQAHTDDYIIFDLRAGLARKPLLR